MPAFKWGNSARCCQFHDAVKDGELETIHALLKQHPDWVNGKDKYGFTPLHWAAVRGHKEVAELLLANQANVNAKGHDCASDPAHAFSSEGIGLNMGCPIRLSRALDVLFSLKPEHRSEPLAQLRARKNHFAGVEELLWLTLWKQQTEVSRGGELVQQTDGNKAADIDWFFFSAGVPVYLEVKFRPTDGMRTPDCGARNVNERFFGNIGRKFPTEKSALRRCLAAITGFEEPLTGVKDADNRFFALCEKKLLSMPGLNAILYRSLLGSVYIYSLEKEVIAQIAALIRSPDSCEYPIGYPVVFNRQLREQRGETKCHEQFREKGHVFFASVPHSQPTPPGQPQCQYRFQISKRSKEGEPVFEYIPPFLNSANADQK